MRLDQKNVIYGIIQGFPCGAVVKNPAADLGDTGDRFNPWVGKILWSRKWQTTPVFLPGKPMNRGAWWITVHEAAKSWTQLS